MIYILGNVWPVPDGQVLLHSEGSDEYQLRAFSTLEAAQAARPGPWKLWPDGTWNMYETEASEDEWFIQGVPLE